MTTYTADDIRETCKGLNIDPKVFIEALTSVRIRRLSTEVGARRTALWRELGSYVDMPVQQVPVNMLSKLGRFVAADEEWKRLNTFIDQHITCEECLAQVPRTGQVPYDMCNYADCCGGWNGHMEGCKGVDRTFCPNCGTKF